MVSKNEFYRGRFPGSFARGLPFQENPRTGDCRISGTCASLAGLEKALREEGPDEVELAIRRILLIHGIILTVGGIPLLYLGDDVATLNVYSYRDDPHKAHDSRWVHRPRTDRARHELRSDPETVEGRVYAGLQVLIQLRKEHSEFSGGALDILENGNPHVLGFERTHQGKRVVIFANFSEQEQVITARVMEQHNCLPLQQIYGSSRVTHQKGLTLTALDLVVLQACS